MPIITLEVMSDACHLDNVANDDMIESVATQEIIDEHPETTAGYPRGSTGVHFLTEEQHEETDSSEREQDNCQEPGKGRNEYMIRNDGSVVCKLCGEILQNRTQWYRHKYKQHVAHQLNPAPLFQCEQCLVYFKTRKGFIGHLASRHKELLSTTSVANTAPIHTQAEVIIEKIIHTQVSQETKASVDPELSIPKSTLPNFNTVTNKPAANSVEKKTPKSSSSHSIKAARVQTEEMRSREERLVADIIDRVRRECETQGAGGAARRGYSRRTTVMHT